MTTVSSQNVLSMTQKASSQPHSRRYSSWKDNGSHAPLAEQTGMNAHLYQHKFMDSLGARLRRKRREMGWTQEQLAVKAGTNQAVIQKIENGKSLRPRKIDEIAEVLEVNPAWLMFGGRSANLSEEALAIAETWESIPEPARSRIKEEIRRLAQKPKR